MSEERGVKTDQEIMYIKKACMITDTIFSRLLAKFDFTTEREIADFLNIQIKKYSEGRAFPVIVASGKNAADPHHTPNDTALKGFVVIDFGVIYKGYRSDMTRTIFVGTPLQEERKLYQTVLRALEEARSVIAPNIRCSFADERAREILGTDLSRNFIHALGHGVGKRIHEYPKISARSKFSFRANMVVTVEPGVYFKKWGGIRIEDTCVITKNGCVALTHSPKDLVVIPL
jgi:Xaa-Pro aminopeptidase